MCSFYEVETLFIFRLLCVWDLCMPWCTHGCQRAAFRGEGSLLRWVLEISVGCRACTTSTFLCWAVLLAPTLFRGSSVLWYSGCCSLDPETYAPFFFEPFGQCAWRPFIFSVFFLGLMQSSPWSLFLLQSIHNCVPCGLSEKHCYFLSRILRDRPLIQHNEYLSQIPSFFVI